MGNEVAIIPQALVPAFSFNEVEKIASAIARGGLFGSKDPYAVLTLCMLAQAEGQHPAVVFRDYDLIQGKPAKKAEAMLRDFVSSGGKVVWNNLDDECADATFSHPQGGTVTINWTMARAQKAQLGGKDMWKKYPRQMLRSRTVSEGVRTVYPGATSGLYVPEEVRDFGNDSAPSDTPPTPEPKRARDLKTEQPKAIEATPSPQPSDFSGQLADLKALATPGNTDALGAAWKNIGADARKALAAELPALKAACEEPVEDVAFDAETGEITDHPAQTTADALIASFDAADANIDLIGLKSQAETDIAAMPVEIASAVMRSYQANKARLEEAFAKAKAGEAEAVE